MKLVLPKLNDNNYASGKDLINSPRLNKRRVPDSLDRAM